MKMCYAKHDKIGTVKVNGKDYPCKAGHGTEENEMKRNIKLKYKITQKI